LATSNDEVDLTVNLLECPIGVAPFGWWWRCSLLPVTVRAIIVVLVTSIIASVVVTIIMAIITTIASVVVTPVVAVIATVVVAFVITAVVATIIMPIPIVIARIGPAVTVILSIRSTITIVKALATVAVIVAIASGLLGGRWDFKGTLQLLALPHGVLGVTVELALVVHDHIEVTFEEGGRSWWFCYIGFARSLARPGASTIVVFSIKVMHYCILLVD
jgi:hypothetical protein